MSWEDIMRRVLPPIGGLSPHPTSAYGATNRPRGSTNPHRGVDFNYNVGPNGQRGINLQHPALRSPVDGIVTNAGQGTAGRIAIRDANGFSHEILHTHARHVAIGDPVVAGQLIGTMGNTGVNSKEPKKGDHHVHSQLKDPAGNRVNPTAFWNEQGPVDPNPAPPGFLGEYQQYLRGLGANAGNAAPRSSGGPSSFDTGGRFVPGSASSSRPLYETRSLVAPPDESASPETRTSIPRLSRRFAGQPEVILPDTTMPALPPNEVPADPPTSFVGRFADWASSAGASAPRGPYQPGPQGEAVRPLGIVSGEPMPDWPFPPPIWGFPDRPPTRDEEDWEMRRLRSADWNKKVR
jgi:hypothetical protein